MFALRTFAGLCCLSVAASRRAYTRGVVRMMPEGPEVRSLVETLDIKLGRSRYCLSDVTVLSGRYLKEEKLTGLDRLRSVLADPSQSEIKIEQIRSKGKFIYITCESGISIWTTLGLTGGYTLSDPSYIRFPRVKLHLNPVIADTGPVQLLFYDQRNFGTLRFCFDEDELQKKLVTIGYDWLDKTSRPSLEVFTTLGKQAAKRKRPLCVFLMDQKKTSGIGNYLLSEILYKTRIHPNAITDSIDYQGWVDLYNAIVDLIECSYNSQSPLTDASLKEEFRFNIYSQQLTPEGSKVVRSIGTHKRTIHFDPLIQNRFSPH